MATSSNTEDFLDNKNDNNYETPEEFYRYISEDELKIIKRVTKGKTMNLDIYGNPIQQYFISDKYDSQDEWRKGYGSDYQKQADSTAVNSTLFPEVIEICVLNKYDKKPIKGIAIGIRLFASAKNNYYFLTDISDNNGVIVVTKAMLNEEIRNTRNLFTMDFVSDLEDCKPYIEIISDDRASINQRLKRIKKIASVYKPAKRVVYIYKKCKNNIISNQMIVNINQDAVKQEINFYVEKNRGAV